MKELKFNEQSAIENMMKVKFVDVNNITNTIYSLAKYNYHVLHLDDDANYDRILKYITENCSNIYEAEIYKDINGCIKNAKKYAFVSIDEVCITESEMCKIRSLQDIREEKAAFVLLAIAKYFNALNGAVYDSAFMTNIDICNMARITIPTKDRDVFMQFAYDKEVLYRHTWSDSTIKKLTFVSHEDNDKVLLRLCEGDFKDLAYVYLSYLRPYEYRRCVGCGCLMKKNKKDTRLCEKCSAKEVVEKDKAKTVECIDCHKTFTVSVLNTKSCRCDVCQNEHRRIYMADLMRKKRESI